MAHGGRYVGESLQVAREGIPSLKANDGPQGYRNAYLPRRTNGTSTDFPCGADWLELIAVIVRTMMLMMVVVLLLVSIMMCCRCEC